MLHMDVDDKPLKVFEQTDSLPVCRSRSGTFVPRAALASQANDGSSEADGAASEFNLLSQAPGPWDTSAMDSEVELQLRQLIFQRLAEIVAEHGVVTRPELETLQVGDETRRIIDRSRGIWNPENMLATLSVISNPAGPYADAHVGDSFFAYDYRAGSTDGDNKKMRRAYELGLPIILLRTIRPGVFVPVFPVYVVKDDIDNRQFVLALDESLRFVSDPLHLKPIEREYAIRAIKQRLHQPEFRGRIMVAYERELHRVRA